MSQMDKLSSIEHGGSKCHSCVVQAEMVILSGTVQMRVSPCLCIHKQKMTLIQVGFTVVPCKWEMKCVSLKHPGCPQRDCVRTLGPAIQGTM